MVKAKSIIEYIVGMLLGFAFGITITISIVSAKIVALENQVVESYDKGYSDGENDAVIDFMEDLIDVLIENAVLEERLKWLSPTVVIHDFNPNYDFHLLVVVSREESMNDGIWTYGLQMLDDNSETAYVDSDKLFSIGEHVVAVELNDNSIILIDLS